MALSLDSIYKPLNDFFLQKFGDDNDASVAFRFAHLPRLFYDEDFLLMQQPSPVLANELFSMVVDAVPRLDDDGRTVWLSITSRLSDLYSDEILGPAIPFVPTDVTDEIEKQARIDAFNSAKAKALELLTTIRTASLQDGAVQFHPSTAHPERWWDKSDASWTPISFPVKGAVTSPGQPAQPSNQLLQMKVSDAVAAAVVASYTATPVPPPPPVAQVAAAAPSLRTRATFFPRESNGRAADHCRDGTAFSTHPERKSSDLRYWALKQRQEILSDLAAKAKTQPVTTNDVTISFDYCVVDVTRDWLPMAFIDNRSWRIPGQARSQLSANDGHGLPALPVGFVAVKALKIQAPWTDDDKANLEQSVQFGPFRFDSQVVDGAIGHEGIQIIGWMLQPLPDLPPNDLSTQGRSPPASNGTPPTPSPADAGVTPEQPPT
jgi:hypothetical protein